jgi:uncharacterized RDD family membrane protein YckC
MTEKKITLGTRLGAMILDHIMMTIIMVLFMLPGLISEFDTQFSVSHEQTMHDPFAGIYFWLFGFALYFCKDCINGRSIAKRILKLQIVDNKTGQVASPLKCFVRDVFCILWPIEIIIALINPSRRIGDLVAGTKLISFDPSLEQPKPNYAQIALSIGIAYGIMLLFMIPFNRAQSKLDRKKIDFSKQKPTSPKTNKPLQTE